MSADELARAIRAAHSGRATLSPEAAQALVYAANQPPAPGQDLTECERAALALMVEGLRSCGVGFAQRIGYLITNLSCCHPILPQLAETNTPQLVDAAGGCLL